MRGWLLTLSLLSSTALVFWIQTFNFELGYLFGISLIALHFLVVALYFTKPDIES